jgi:hypothetical protein
VLREQGLTDGRRPAVDFQSQALLTYYERAGGLEIQDQPPSREGARGWEPNSR